MRLEEGSVQATEGGKLSQGHLVQETQLQGCQMGEACANKIQVFLY